jgi:hypothetical protein
VKLLVIVVTEKWVNGWFCPLYREQLSVERFPGDGTQRFGSHCEMDLLYLEQPLILLPVRSWEGSE